VLEAIPPDLAEEVTAAVSIPTIGIGAGARCDGQVLVCYDLLGMYRDLKPKFAKRFAEVGDQIVGAVRSYVGEVQARSFPTAEHSFKPNQEVIACCTHSCVQALVQQLGFAAHTASTQGSPPQPAPRASQLASHELPLFPQQEGFCAHTMSTQGLVQIPPLSGAAGGLELHTECGQVGPVGISVQS
jgi:hypothetical protein